MKCQRCRKFDAIDTDWEKFRAWLMFKLFAHDVSDEKSASFTQGFSDGYIAGRKHQAEFQERNNGKLFGKNQKLD